MMCRTLRLSMIAALLAAMAAVAPVRAQMLGSSSEGAIMDPMVGGPVTAWTLLADRLGGGTVNWRTLAIMHIAMHDALNAAEPRYARVMPRLNNQPAARADAELAMASAAYHVLLARHTEQAAVLGDGVFQRVVAATPRGPAADAGRQLGALIARQAVARYRGAEAPPTVFAHGNREGQWRPTPPFFRSALLADANPFLFANAADLRSPPPPAVGSPAYRAAVEEVRRLGEDRSNARTRAQREAASFWGRQTSQRSYVHLAVGLLLETPMRGGSWEEARAMALLTMALADSYIITWETKRHYNYWRPVTALQEGGGGIYPDPQWGPLLPTPPHPEYPSGHAADCAVGSAVLQGLFGPELRGITYTAIDIEGRPTQHYPSLAAAAAECAESRLWAGAHYRFSNDEGLRVGRLIAQRALVALPPVRR